MSYEESTTSVMDKVDLDQYFSCFHHFYTRRANIVPKKTVHLSLSEKQITVCIQHSGIGVDTNREILMSGFQQMHLLFKFGMNQIALCKPSANATVR